jgi:hypothetical protein
MVLSRRRRSSVGGLGGRGAGGGVARLTSAAGASNKQIGAQLFLSPRTVGFHLYRAFPKLGVTTREELARYTP